MTDHQLRVFVAAILCNGRPFGPLDSEVYLEKAQQFIEMSRKNWPELPITIMPEGQITMDTKRDFRCDDFCGGI